MSALAGQLRAARKFVMSRQGIAVFKGDLLLGIWIAVAAAHA